MDNLNITINCIDTLGQILPFPFSLLLSFVSLSFSSKSSSSAIECHPTLSKYLILTSASTEYFNYTPIIIDSERPSEYGILQFYVELYVSTKPYVSPKPIRLLHQNTEYFNFTLNFTSPPSLTYPSSLSNYFNFTMNLTVSSSLSLSEFRIQNTSSLSNYFDFTIIFTVSQFYVDQKRLNKINHLMSFSTNSGTRSKYMS